MPSEPVPADEDPFAVLEAEVDQAIAACDGDLRATVRALLIGQAYLEAQIEVARREASHGFVRGRPSRWADVPA